MKDIAPEITRRRLLIEGFYQIDVDEDMIRDYFKTFTNDLSLRTYGDPIIFCPNSLGKEENEGYDAFVPLIDSGISLYVWTKQKFFSVIIYTCKDFDEKQALEVTNEFFKTTKFEKMSF